jgi:ascorbate PTS system EIIC component
MSILSFLMNDILSQPAVLIGLFALIGLLAQRRPSTEVITGSLKATIGFLILGAGANTLVAALSNFSSIFTHAFNITGVIPNNEAIVSLAQKTFGAETAMIMVFGMLVNILLARITPLKYIFLTGHHTMFMACMLSAILVGAGFSGVTLVLIGSIILGSVMVVFPAMAQPFMKKITGSEEVALGHFGTTGYVVSALIGKLVGKPENSTEEMNFPKGLMFLRDTTVATSLTMLILFLITAIVAGPEFIHANVSGGQNYILFAILQSLTFAAGVYIVLAGVRMIIGEIIPAFKGFADKIVPNAKPALDCPIVFPYAPIAVIIGFISSFVAGIVGMFILTAMSATVIIPGVIPHFFCGATAGVFGNATGGKRGAIAGSFVHGLLITFLPVLLLPVLGALGYANTTFGDADFGIVGILFGNIFKLFIQ